MVAGRVQLPMLLALLRMHSGLALYIPSREVLPGDLLTIPSNLPKTVVNLKVDIGPGSRPMMPSKDTLLILIEPQREAAAKLRKMFKDRSNVHVVQAAISNFTGAATLSPVAAADGAPATGVAARRNAASPWSLAELNASMDCSEGSEPVNVTTLARVIQRLPLSHFKDQIQMLKVDTQGGKGGVASDLAIVKSAGNLIAKVKAFMLGVGDEASFQAYLRAKSRELHWLPVVRVKIVV